jgi:hypothetical protein
MCISVKLHTGVFGNNFILLTEKVLFSVWEYVAWHLGAQETKGKENPSVCIGKLPHFQHIVPFGTYV